MKRDQYYDDLAFWCEDCGIEFHVDGHIVPTSWPDFRIIPAVGDHVRCPNDDGHLHAYMDGTRRIPTHDVSYIGEDL